jgi:hypothetical protein
VGRRAIKDKGEGNMNTKKKSIYQAMKDKNIPTYSHESDLYVPVNADSREIVRKYFFLRNVTLFIDAVDGKPYFDIPFGYDPWYDKFSSVVDNLI